MSKLLDVMTAPWAITSTMLQEIGGIYLTHLRGDKIDLEGVEAKLGHPLNNEKIEMSVVDGVAIISAHGVVAKRANLFMQISGGVSTEILGGEIQSALDDVNIKAIILDIDSPGGTVDGTFELADALYGVRGDKPIVALANGLMASAAYAIGSACDAVYISGATTHVGSIGVVTAHTDYSKYEEKTGIKTTEIYAGKYKRIASQHEPLTAEGKEEIQAGVDYLYSVFVDRVATFRGVAVSTVLEDMADGRLFIGQQAIDAGLVDGVSTLDNLIAELSNGRMPEKQTSVKATDAGVASAATETSTNNSDEEPNMSGSEKTILVTAITAAYLSENHPDIVATLQEDGVAAATTDGAIAERERIQGVLAHSTPGHETLIETMAFDGTTTPDQAAAKVLTAVNEARVDTGANIEKDAEGLNAVDASVDADLGDDKSIAHLPFEEQCQAKWDKSAELRDEFVTFDCYLSYEKGMKNGGKVLGATNK